MDATTLLAIVFLALMLANAAHWMFTRRGALFWTPSGKGRLIWRACLAVVSAAAIASLAGWLPAHVFPWIFVPLVAGLQLLSIVHRQAIAPDAA